jgi:peptide/nickel transport system substrate-binding protein/glutathione transport system substrate-binding protein
MMNIGSYKRYVNKLGYAVYIIVFASDVKNSPMSDVRVRKAICYAIDSDIISEKLGYGMTIANNQYGMPGTKFYNKDIEGYPYNPEKAKELLEEAGYTEGFTTTMYTGNDMDMTSWMVAVQGYLKEVGINMRIEILDVAEWVGTYLYDIPEGMIFGPRHSFSSNIVNQVLSNFSYNAINGVGMLNKCMLHPADLNDALQKAVAASNEDEMLANFKDACKLLFDEYCLAYSLANSNSSVIICKDNIIDKGCFDTGSDFPDYNLIYAEN